MTVTDAIYLLVELLICYSVGHDFRTPAG